MKSTYKQILLSIALISILYFISFVPPNSTGAKDKMMISIFEGDEFAQYGVVIKMLTPYEELDKTVLNFIAYRHYYYGSPFYFSSALVLLPIQLAQNVRQTSQLNMLILRQFINVLPMLGAIILLVYTQTKFRSYAKSIGLCIFLLSIPAVVENNLWWHADALAVFFVSLAIFFLDRDALRFGSNFWYAAVATGLATGTKVIGLFFFLAIPTYLLVGLYAKKLTWRALITRAFAFVGIMALTIVISNPFLLIPSQFERMIRILSNQSDSMSVGWTLHYAKGPASWFTILNELYGKPAFIALSLFALTIGVWKSADSLRHLLIATWAIPFGLYILFVIAIKPTHFFLPILLPVYSSLIVLFDLPPFTKSSNRTWHGLVWGMVVIMVIGLQFAANLQKDATLYQDVMTREEQNKELAFYETIQRNYLPLIQTDEKIKVFRDVKTYFPESSMWIIRSYWNSSYKTIKQTKPDVIILWAQRIFDYTRPGAQEDAVDPASFQDTYQFYLDADRDQITGYRLIYRDDAGLLFVSDELYERFFKEQ